MLSVEEQQTEKHKDVRENQAQLIFEKSKPGSAGKFIASEDIADEQVQQWIPANVSRQSEPLLPEVSEPEVVRHFTRLSQKNFSIDTNFYPLGSCTMKHNPRVNEDVAALPKFAGVHPYQPESTVQGILSIFWDLEQWLKVITGMDRFTLQPAAGAHGELLGMMIAKAYHDANGESHRRKVIVPDSSHGTNPASAALYGFEVVTIPSGANGCVDIEALRAATDENTACLMLTNPNTLGLFEAEIIQVQKIMHDQGALLYYDGANMNALLGLARPGDMGFDIVHLNLHKTFSTPHGGGGPGAGPVGVKKRLEKFLPKPMIVKEGDKFVLNGELPDSIGKIKSFYGNAGMLLRAYTYIRRHGAEGLRQISRDAIINANYLKKRLEDIFSVPYAGFCMHEFVASAENQKQLGINTLDIAKRLLDYGCHAPTVYFPLIVKEAIMVEPTETETKETLDRFSEILHRIVEEAKETPDLVKYAPHTLPVSRPDEVQAARFPVLTYRDCLAQQ